MTVKLSVLDQGPVTKGNRAPDALHKAVELAQLAEKLGYERIWMAEHHNTDAFASSAPEITTAYIAAKTEKIRVGTGGTMIMHYSPYKVAEVFKTLSSLAPDRIDFGIGRAPGGDQAAIYALAEGRSVPFDELYGKIDDTLKLIADEEPINPVYQNLITSPVDVPLPEAWLLGSSGQSAMQAGEMGLGYSYAQFFTGNISKEIFDMYRRSFRPSRFMKQPKVMVCYFVTVAETREEAEYQARPADLARLALQRGRIIQYLTPEEAHRVPLSEMDKMLIQENRKMNFVGSAKDVAERLVAEQETYGFDEAMICTIPHSQKERLNAYRLLAKELL